MDLISYILSKKYADKLFAGGGAAKGKNCTIQSIEEIEGGNRVTFQWTLDDGTVQTDTLDVMNGAPGEQGPKGNKGDQGETGPAGANGQDGRDGVDGQDGAPGIDGKDGKDGVNGQDGADGVGIVSILKTRTVDLVDTYTITFTNGETSTFDVTNGADGASTAEDVEYDNSGTHLEATNLQDAIDEIANGSSSKPNIKAIYEESPSTAVHSVDDYIYYDSHLYKVIAAIAIGDTLVVDTNIELASEVEEGTEVFIENLPGERGGAAKGKNCTIQSIEEIEGGNRVTFQWTLDDGTVQTDTLDVMNGTPGEQGPKGDDGFSPTIEVKESTPDRYVLTITDDEGSYDTPNLKGSGGGMNVRVVEEDLIFS